MKLNWFLKSLLMEESAGDAGGGGGTGGDSTALAVTTGTDLATIDSGDGGDGAGGDSTALATTGADSAAVYEGGKLSRGTTKTFRQLETANPAARPILAEAQRALGGWAKIKSMFGPKPFDKINALRKFEKEAGGMAGLQALREASEDLVKSDELYEKADPQLIAMMTETPAAKQAFVKLFPHSVAKLRELAPMTYTRWLGMQQLHSLEKAEVSIKSKDGTVLGTEPIDIPFRLRRIVGMLPWAMDATGKFTGGTVTPEQMQTFQADLSYMFSYLDTVRAYANSTPEDLTPPKEDTSAAQIAKANKDAEDAIQNSWKVQRDAICNDIVAEEVRKQTKGMDLSSTIIADITAKSRKSINDIRKGQPDNTGKVKAFFDAKNVSGYIAYNKRIVQDHAASAVEKAVGLYARKSSRRAPAAVSAAPVAAPGTQGVAPAANAPQAGKIVKLTAQQGDQLGGRHGTRWMKQQIFPGDKGTTKEMRASGQMMLRRGNPLNLPDGTVVQF